MKPPVIPPDRAFAVDGVVDRRVRAALAEARRIRDGWADAVDAAKVAAHADAAQLMRSQLTALAEFRAQLTTNLDTATQTRAIELASQLVGAHFTARPEAVQAQLTAVLAARPDWIEVRVPAGLIDDLSKSRWADLNLQVDPALRLGELILVGPNGTVDARFATRLARIDAQ